MLCNIFTQQLHNKREIVARLPGHQIFFTLSSGFVFGVQWSERG